MVLPMLDSSIQQFIALPVRFSVPDFLSGS